MSERTDLPFNSRDPEARWQANLLAMARALPYPPTPDVRAAVRARLAVLSRAGPRAAGRPLRLAWVLAAIVVALLALLAVPAVRAALLDFLQIGAVRIILGPTSTPIATGAPAASTPTPAPTPLLSVLDLAGQTTLADARQRAGFTIRLPAYPPDLGPPDVVYLQDLDGPAVILVWLQPGDRTKVRLSLQFLSSSALADKMMSMIKQDPNVEFAQVNGRTAVWTTGPYILETRSGNYTQQRLIQGHALIWTDGTLTYRLETDLAMGPAERIAESLGK